MAGIEVSALHKRYPDGTMIVDELGTLTYSEVDTRTNALAHALSDTGIVEGDDAYLCWRLGEPGGGRRGRGWGAVWVSLCSRGRPVRLAIVCVRRLGCVF